MRKIFYSRGRGLLTAGLIAAAAAGLTACASGPGSAAGLAAAHPKAAPAAAASTTAPAPAPSTAAPAPPATTAPAPAPAPSTAAPAPAPSPSLVPMQTPTGGEFLSPTANIRCTVVVYPSDIAYCETLTPPESVTMDATGHYTTCTGAKCLGDVGELPPTLSYGTATGVGPFVCQSATTGMTCTAAGRGFTISRAGITPAGS